MFIKVGKIHSTQGLKGEVFVQVFSGELSWLKELKVLRLSESEEQEPHLEKPILSARPHKKKGLKGFAAKIKDCGRIEDVQGLVGHLFYLPEDLLTSAPGENIFLREILGFSVEDQSRGLVGQVVGFSDNGAQDLVIIENAEARSFEVPLVKPLLVSIDFETLRVFMDIPWGLLPTEEI